MLTFYSTLQDYWLRPFYCTVSHHYEEEPTPPRSTPWGAYRSAATTQCMNLWIICLHSHTSLIASPSYADRSMVVGHILMVHTCSFLYTCHIDMTVHTPSFLWLGDHSTNLLWGEAHMHFIADQLVALRFIPVTCISRVPHAIHSANHTKLYIRS